MKPWDDSKLRHVPFFVILALWVGLLVVFLLTVLGSPPAGYAQSAGNDAAVASNQLDQPQQTPAGQSDDEIAAPAAGQGVGSNEPRAERPDRKRFTEERFTLKRERTTGLALVLKILIFLIFSMMLLTPFIPGIIELQNPTDEEALPVDLNYSRDPRYFGNSFRKLVDGAVDAQGPADAMIEINLSRPERVEVCASKKVPDADRVRHVLFARGDLEMGDNAVLQKDSRVLGNAFLQNDCFFRALAVDGNVVLGPRTRFTRWLDAEGNIMVEEGCTLGISCASGKTIMLGPDTHFRRLFGSPVRTHGDRRPDVTRQPTMSEAVGSGEPPKKLETIEDDLDFVNGNLTVYENDAVQRDLLVTGDLTAQDGVVFHGSIRVHGTAVLGRDVTVRGNMFCEGAISLDDDCQVLGNVFGQDTIFVGRGCRLGQRGKIKSVIGKKAVTLSADVTVHGYVLTEGRGIVL